jgi:hypothetical protein
MGATPVAGDIETPETWIAGLPRLDAAIHMACDFSSDMEAVERRLMDALLPALAAHRATAFHLYRRRLAVWRDR